MNAKILPYVIDWVFVLVLGILMAALSFLIDFLIEKISQGAVDLHSDDSYLGVRLLL